MEVFEAIAKRHSYRGPFFDKEVKRDDLKRIVQAGLQAPSGRNEQTTSFVIIDDPGLLEKIGQMHQMEAMHSAKAMIACILDVQPEAVYEGYSFQVEDCAAAVENMLLAITALGYATVWIDGWLRVDERAQQVAQLLELSQGKIVRILLPIGVPAQDWPQKEKKPFNERAWFNKYEG